MVELNKFILMLCNKEYDKYKSPELMEAFNKASESGLISNIDKVVEDFGDELVKIKNILKDSDDEDITYTKEMMDHEDVLNFKREKEKSDMIYKAMIIKRMEIQEARETALKSSEVVKCPNCKCKLRLTA